jgi:hypothetical protein
MQNENQLHKSDDQVLLFNAHVDLLEEKSDVLKGKSASWKLQDQ